MEGSKITKYRRKQMKVRKKDEELMKTKDKTK